MLRKSETMSLARDYFQVEIISGKIELIMTHETLSGGEDGGGSSSLHY